MQNLILQATKKINRGLFIALEGLDKSGKSTQAKLLTQNLQGKKIQFPDRNTLLGSIISDYLKGNKNLNDEVIHLLFSANRWEQYNSILNYIQNGTNVICDRYAYSGVAFSTAKGLPINWCKNPDERLIRPDITFYLKGSINELSKRGDYGSEIYENLLFQEKVGLIFNKLIITEGFIVIDALQSIDQIQNEILNIILQKINNLEQLPIQKLWKDNN